jgi:transcriptional regulator with XRE-family HTH domain
MAIILRMREELRAYLNSRAATLARIEEETNLTYSWLSKFKRGVIQNPTTDHLIELENFRREDGELENFRKKDARK